MGLGTPSTSGCPIPWIPSTCSGLLTTLTSAVEGQMPPVRQNWGHLGATAGGGDPHGDRGPRGGWHLLQALAEADHSLLLLCSLDGAGPEAPDLADGITGGQVPLLAQVTGQQGACPAMAQHAVNCHSLGQDVWVALPDHPVTPWVTGDARLGSAFTEPRVTFSHPHPSSSQVSPLGSVNPLRRHTHPVSQPYHRRVFPSGVTLPRCHSSSHVPLPLRCHPPEMSSPSKVSPTTKVPSFQMPLPKYLPP